MKEDNNIPQTPTLQRQANEWWNNLPATDRFRLLQENGYQDKKKPWKYRPLTDKGIYLMWSRQNGN
jgi:hypothetical protein